MRALVWFRADLRVEDNPALFHACRAADGGVVAAFTVCPGQWRGHDWGAPKVDFLLRNLRILGERLTRLNIPLKIVTTPDFKGVPRALTGLAEECGCDALYLNSELEWNEARRDEAVTRAFEESGRRVHLFRDQVLFAPGSIRTKGDGTFYEVFSPFKKACWAAHERGETAEPLPEPEPAGRVEIAPDEVPDRVEGFARFPVGSDLWPAGEGEANRRLEAFVADRLEEYKDRRDDPADTGTSTLSPYLALGVTSPAICLRPVLERTGGRLDKGGRGEVAWINEILWREFYRHIVVGFPRVCMGRAFRREYEAIPWRDDPEGLEAWKRGQTGYPIVDAGMRCLLETGWMHNRVRMITAMFLTKHLLIDWREGERHFMRHLVDGDLASNNGGWQWSASTGTDAQPYFRIFNPVSQSRRFDPEGAFIRRWVPELRALDGKVIHEPWASPLAASSVDYPPPVVDQKAGRERALSTFEAARG